MNYLKIHHVLIQSEFAYSVDHDQTEYWNPVYLRYLVCLFLDTSPRSFDTQSGLARAEFVRLSQLLVPQKDPYRFHPAYDYVCSMTAEERCASAKDCQAKCQRLQNEGVRGWAAVICIED